MINKHPQDRAERLKLNAEFKEKKSSKRKLKLQIQDQETQDELRRGKSDPSFDG